jgi:threonine synthase
VIAYCPTSRFRIDAELSPLRCPITGDPLEFTELPAFHPERIDAHEPGLWRYAAMLPVVAEGRKRVSLGEGWTPLIADTWHGRPVLWKMDAIMPTGSYKDRGVSVMVNWLAGLGAETLVDDSSGNAGASVACYSGRAGVTATIYVPASAPEPKKAQIAVYGGELVEVPGPRSQCALAAENATSGSHDIAYASHAWHPAFVLGMMTLAWEIWEQMGQRVPDWVVAPVGNGGLMLGMWRGFQHLRKSGIIDRLPRLVSVQAEPFTPVHEGFTHGARMEESPTLIQTISADGIAISHPVRGAAVVEALHQSGGRSYVATEAELTRAHTRLARRGLYVEPTSATVAAALHALFEEIDEGDEVVAILTGHGLKHPPRAESRSSG